MQSNKIKGCLFCNFNQSLSQQQYRLSFLQKVGMGALNRCGKYIALFYFISILIIPLLSACDTNYTTHDKNTSEKDTLQKNIVSNYLIEKKYKVEVFKIDGDNLFGFNIYEENKKIIHQEIIPCLSGNRNFSSKKDAGAVGNLMMLKIKNGNFPPSITKHDLDSLDIK